MSTINEIFPLVTEAIKKYHTPQIKAWLAQRYQAKKFKELTVVQLEDFLKFIKEQSCLKTQK